MQYASIILIISVVWVCPAPTQGSDTGGYWWAITTPGSGDW